MTLEEKLRRYADKGELVHISLAFRPSDQMYHAKLALASTAGGYSSAEHKDPVQALLDVFAAAPVKTRAPKITATVTEPLPEPSDLSGLPDGKDPLDLMPQEWTKP